MASSTDWARTIGTTLVLHLKEEELATFRKYKVFALLEGSGRVAMNHGSEPTFHIVATASLIW